MKARDIGLVLLVMAILPAGRVPGGDQTVPEAPDLEDHPEVDEVLQALDEAGVPPTREELERFLRGAGITASPEKGSGGTFPLGGELILRASHDAAGLWDRYGRVNLATRWLRVRARFRRAGEDRMESSGAVELGTPAAEIRLGNLGLAQGYGLLLGAPGRRSGLAADAGLGPPRGRVVTWLGAPEAGTLEGMACSLRRGRWGLNALAGRPALPAGPDGRAVTTAARLDGGGDGWSAAVAVMMAQEGESGGSLAWSVGPDNLVMNAEALFWRAGPRAKPTLAAVGQLGWAVTRSAGVELQWGFSDLARGPDLASRPAVLPGWSGRGVTLRAYAPLARDLRVRALWHRGILPDRTGVQGLEEKSLVDVQAVKRLTTGVKVDVRYRHGGRLRREWSERYPWEPAQTVLRENRGVLSGQISWEGTAGRVRLMVRTFARESPVVTGRRSMASITGRLPWGRGWALRASWAAAWGAPVDLVSAVSPLTGMVLPRHWGRWSSETVLGLEWNRRGARLQIAGSRRQPGPGLEAGPASTLWAQAGWAW